MLLWTEFYMILRLLITFHNIYYHQIWFRFLNAHTPGNTHLKAASAAQAGQSSVLINIGRKSKFISCKDAEWLWDHQGQCIKLVVVIYLGAVRINQLKVKSWVCKYVPVLVPGHSRSFPGEEERAERNVGDSRDADSSGDTGAVTLLHSTHFAESG